MTPFRQIEANWRNALRSTGPKTDEGKQQSRRNALRHGLTTEAVIDCVEDREDYRAFEAIVVADYDARTADERELVLWLASLLWRLRRIISIETDLLKIQSDIVHERQVVSVPSERESSSNTQLPPLVFEFQREKEANGEGDTFSMSVRALTCCFLRLTNVDNGAFERLGRYNAALWKQAAQTLLLLHPIRRI
jgi:hypothetical protein